MNKPAFAAEYYFHSGNKEHERTVGLLESWVAACKKDGFEIDLKAIDCDNAYSEVPTDLPALPCLRRVAPMPERLMVGPLRNEEEFRILLGVATKVRNGSGERFGGWTRKNRD